MAKYSKDRSTCQHQSIWHKAGRTASGTQRWRCSLCGLTKTDNDVRGRPSSEYTCPYCGGAARKNGKRYNIHEIKQLYLCTTDGCGKTFTI